ncbi:gamma-glutamylcyclotransferase family protein [Aspergillus candidus]|uniref:Putative gamma-glutamylcyclotransferase n=1 Tax=Aspergillus candidus TaxID=41067 RepID=A0A2I2FD98_ASPCN|nr:hypothetical protein BDW47DRAFT_105059 [Aspergillus candidus]PLB38564.1 hypothetical protein BDW47DRAFT_105059 [Aspergillus candidus]
MDHIHLESAMRTDRVPDLTPSAVSPGDMESRDHPPPPPPPPPPQDPRSKISPYVLKLRQVPHTFLNHIPRPTGPPPTGPYFFYGTLTDPCLVRELLELDHEPEFRPAYVEGYECKLWGPYPALVDVPGSTVEGAVYQVTKEEHAERLAFYETINYRADPCCIYYRDGKEPAQDSGCTFVYAGSRKDLRDGVFDLRAWLGRMGGSRS